MTYNVFGGIVFYEADSSHRVSVNSSHSELVASVVKRSSKNRLLKRILVLVLMSLLWILKIGMHHACAGSSKHRAVDSGCLTLLEILELFFLLEIWKFAKCPGNFLAEFVCFTGAALIKNNEASAFCMNNGYPVSSTGVLVVYNIFTVFIHHVSCISRQYMYFTR